MMVGSMKKRRDTAQLTTLTDSDQLGAERLETLYDGYYDRIYAYAISMLFSVNLCISVAKNGAVWDKFGVVLAYFGNIKIPKTAF